MIHRPETTGKQESHATRPSTGPTLPFEAAPAIDPVEAFRSLVESRRRGDHGRAKIQREALRRLGWSVVAVEPRTGGGA